MLPIPASKTLYNIDSSIKADQGASYRQALGTVIGKMDDAYRGAESPFRSHLGASLIGKECLRELWYIFRWAKKSNFDGRLLRLFNRGHLEEARFLAMLISIGAQVYFEDESGNQYKISEWGGHFGGSCDGVVVDIPDLPPGEAALLEFKTMALNPFKKLVKVGCRIAKPEHFAQMQVYMHKLGLKYALYMVVNKNDDSLYAEIIHYDQYHAQLQFDKAQTVITSDKPPERGGATPGSQVCKYCDYQMLCHKNIGDVAVNCRTCVYSAPVPDGTWTCNLYNTTLEKQFMYSGCQSYDRKF